MTCTFSLCDNTEPQVAYAVTNDCDPLDTFYIEVSAFVIPEHALADTHFIALKEFVARLFQRIGLIPKLRPEVGGRLLSLAKNFL